MPERRWFLTAVAISLLISTSYVVTVKAAKVYSWTDDDGTVHFGDKPAHGNADEIKVKPASVGDPSGVHRLERSKKLLDSLTADRKEREQLRADEEQAKKEKAEQCSKAKAHFKDLTEAQFIYDESDSGDILILDFKQRAKAEQDAAQQMRKLCGES